MVTPIVCFGCVNPDITAGACQQDVEIPFSFAAGTYSSAHINVSKHISYDEIKICIDYISCFTILLQRMGY